MPKTHIIIGASAAGIAAVRTLCRLASYDRIICIVREPELPYNTCLLVDYFSQQKTLDQITMVSHVHMEQMEVSFILGVSVDSIDRTSKKIMCSNGCIYTYDTLLIATGTSPCTLFPEKQSSGIFTFHTRADVDRLLEYIKIYKPQRAVVIGSGLTGIEATDGLHAHGIEVALIERASHIMPSSIDIQGAVFLARRMLDLGICIYENTTVVNIDVHEKNLSQSVTLSNGKILSADLIVYAVGVTPNSWIAGHAGIDICNGYICVNDHMQTSDPSICAAGDVVHVLDRISQKRVPSVTWPDAMQQGMVAAHTMVGIEKKYEGVVLAISSSFFDFNFVSSGVVHSELYGYQVIRSSNSSYKALVYDDNNQLKGFILIGDTKDYPKLKRELMLGL